MISEFYKNESNDNAVSSRKMAALWLRGSNPQGLDYQEKVCNEFAEHNGISIKKTYGCMGVSTGQQGELLNNMVSEVTQDQEINVILVFSADRLSRKEPEVSELKALLKEKGMGLIIAGPNNKQSE